MRRLLAKLTPFPDDLERYETQKTPAGESNR
jgi:hypothetical protein